MKSKKLFNCLTAGVAIFSLVSCGEKQITRDEAKADMTNIENKDIQEPNKYTYTSEATSSSTTTSLGVTADSSTVSANVTVVYSADDHYFSLDVADTVKVILYEKDNVLNLYTKAFVLETTAKIDLSFTDEMKKLIEEYKISLTNTLKELYSTISTEIMNQLDELSTTAGFEEKYTSSGDGNLSAYVKYSETESGTTSSCKAQFEINNYFLTSFEAYQNDTKVIDFKLQLNKADIVIPASK
jgi:hypothetical protein